MLIEQTLDKLHAMKLRHAGGGPWLRPSSTSSGPARPPR